MATTASFKQQCPSCEAWVPIRDMNLIGRKIDCPKCKYRFVVEDPGSDAEAEEVAEEPKAAKGARRGEGEETRKGVATKAKAGPRRRGEEHDEDEGSDARPKASGGSSKLILGVGLGVVALLLLVVVGLYMGGIIGGDTSKPNPNLATRTLQPSAQETAPQVPSESEKTQAAKPAVTPVSNELLSSLLPPDTEGVCNVRMKELLRTSLGRTIFETPGAFRVEALHKRLGFSMADVEQLIQAWNFTQNWSFNVLRGTKPFNLAAIKVALRLKQAPEGTIEDQEYFVLEPNPWLDNVGRLSFAALLQVNPLQVPVRTEPLALRLHDDRTLVIGSLTPMKQFLAVKGRFPAKSRPSLVKGPEGGTGEGGQRRKNMVSSGGAPAPVAVGGGGPDGRSPEGSGAGTENQAEALSSAYLTIQPALKSMLDQLDASRPVLDLAVDSQAAAGRVPLLGLNTLNFKTVIAEAGVIGAALVLKGDVLFTVAADCLSEDAAKKRFDDLRKKDGFGQKLAAQLAKLLDTRVEMDEEGTGLDLPGGAAFPSGVARPVGGGKRGGGMSTAGGGVSSDIATGGGGGTPIRPNLPTQTEERDKDDRPLSTVQITLPDKTVILVAVHLIEDKANSKLMQGTLREMVLQQKGYLDMAGGGMRVHELAAATRSYAEQHQAQFPRGIAYRSTTSARANRPYPPDQCVSLLAELLPYLGPEQESLYRQIDRQKSWRDPENLPAASTLVPQFLDPQSPPSKWWVQYPGMKEQTAATHYVGIAGIGLDAATYSPTDAAVAKKLGAFGYERTTSVKDITDGASNTILMVQVPPTFRRPWLAGGGSTVAGVPEKDSIRPFVSTQRDGKRGTMAVFADGSVRFIAETVSDDVFKAMCTIKGGEASLIVNRDAPLVPPPEDKVELVAAQPPTTPNKPSTADWKPYNSKEGRFTVLMPVSSPTQMKQTTKTPVGDMDVNVVAAELPNNQGSYKVIYNDLPETATQQPGFDQMILDNAAVEVQTNLPGAKILGEPKKITLESNPGRELSLEAPLVGKMIVRVYIVKTRQYQVIARGPNERLLSKETQAFFDSFKLTGK